MPVYCFLSSTLFMVGFYIIYLQIDDFAPFLMF